MRAGAVMKHSGELWLTESQKGYGKPYASSLRGEIGFGLLIVSCAAAMSDRIHMTIDTERVERFKRQVEEEWQNPQVASGYRKWSAEEAEWGRGARDLIIAQAKLASGMNVLDVGSAHGEPALAVARAVQPGRVALIDIVPELLTIAAERARAAGLENVTTHVADAHALPFPDNSFDRVTCRLTAMYFADPQQAFKEALRVLKPGGVAVYLVWGAFEQPMFKDIIGLLFQYVPPPDDEPGAPSPFAYSQAGTLGKALRDAGFVSVCEESATLPTTFPGSPEGWWEWLVDLAAPVQTWVASLSDVDRRRALAEIHAALRRYYDGKIVTVPIDVIIASGTKAA